MIGIPRPEPCFLDDQTPCGAPNGYKRWKNERGDRYYEWDHTHGHIEVYNKRGRHLGVADPVTGEWIKSAVRGRRIDV
ncbi:colicin E3/pyocin S6 family cytotoxin [Saccharomonospora iraqiensis]|uniref:colicin E3/pyocin S6 family cytotoxin n=1 Tax=Saccharomonospora iraqiensis TaxID=52698 RepID=UPI000A0561E7